MLVLMLWTFNGVMGLALLVGDEIKDHLRLWSEHTFRPRTDP